MNTDDLRFVLLAVLSLGFTAPLPAQATDLKPLPAGAYILDPRHTSVIFRISHLGFSYFTGRFDRAQGLLTFDPAEPEKASLDITLDTNSIDTNDSELDEDLREENWFNVIAYPRATFHATHIEQTGKATAKITGDFTLRGQTHELTLDTTLIGAGKSPLSDEVVMGFSAHTTFDRSAYGINNLQPFVGDEVSLQIDTEFDYDSDNTKDKE